MRPLIHDAAVAMAHVILDRLKAHLPEEELEKALKDVYVACKVGVEGFCIQQDRARRSPPRWWN
jgi:hypothetical protein